MTQRKSLARKLIVLFIVLVILIPCSVLVYDTVVSSNEERVDFYYMMSDGGMGALKKNIPRTDKEAMLKNVLAILQEGPNAVRQLLCRRIWRYALLHWSKPLLLWIFPRNIYR